MTSFWNKFSDFEDADGVALADFFGGLAEFIRLEFLGKNSEVARGEYEDIVIS